MTAAIRPWARRTADGSPYDEVRASEARGALQARASAWHAARAAMDDAAREALAVGLTHAEVADITGLSKPTVLTHYGSKGDWPK